MRLAGKEVTREQVRGTIALLDYFRRFLRSACAECKCPEDRYRTGRRLDRHQARRRLTYLIDMAINRKAGIPDVPSRKHESDYQIRIFRDMRALHDRINRRVRVYQFETAEVRKRFQHLLVSRDDF
jgi:hypothetical protein